MTDAISDRQTQILKGLIDEYIETADAVGSEALEKKYNLGVSPATIRSEMTALTRLGFIKQPHVSAGRVPTPKAMKFYVNQLMEEQRPSLADEVRTKEEMLEARGNVDELMEGVTKGLATKTKTLAVAATDDGDVWHSGYANLFLDPQLQDLEVCAHVFSLLEEMGLLHELFFERISGAFPVEVVFGEELNWPHLDPIGVCATRFSLGSKQGALGVIGSLRLNYPTVVPTLRYFKGILEEIVEA